jgi:hypothetical protein
MFVSIAILMLIMKTGYLMTSLTISFGVAA